jgi:hypothetical protein
MNDDHENLHGHVQRTQTCVFSCTFTTTWAWTLREPEHDHEHVH